MRAGGQPARVVPALRVYEGGFMPIFEYRCTKCGAEFEQLVFGSNPSVECPACQATEVEKLMSACSAKVGFKYTAASKPASACSGCSSGSCSTCG